MHNKHSQRGEWPAILASYIARWHWCYYRLLAGKRKEQPRQRWCSRGLFTSERLHQSGQPWCYWMVTALLLGIRLFLDSLLGTNISPSHPGTFESMIFRPSALVGPMWSFSGRYFCSPKKSRKIQVKRFFQESKNNTNLWILTPPPLDLVDSPWLIRPYILWATSCELWEGYFFEERVVTSFQMQRTKTAKMRYKP